jgi:gliding motility-associated-like protein
MKRINYNVHFLFSIILFSIVSSFAQTITTIAGTGITGNAGNGAQATLATFNHPRGVAVDNAGNVYIAVATSNVIRKINTAGIISNYAGTGIAGYAGNGAQATLATLNGPYSICLDAADNLYIAETGNNIVRKINTATGIISTYAGNGTAGYSGDGLAATSATLKAPIGLTFDNLGNLYISDRSNFVIRKVSASGIISTIAGTPGVAGNSGDGGMATSAKISSPEDIAIDVNDNIYIADAGTNSVRKINKLGIITTFAGKGTVGYTGDGGRADSAKLNGPLGVVIDRFDNIYIADHNNVIRKVTPSGIISTFAGTGIAGYGGDGGNPDTCKLNDPCQCTFDKNGNLYITEWAGQRVRKISGISSQVVPASASIKFYNSFSPNGDGLNDLFVIDNIEEYAKNHVSIYSQWGQILWDKEKYDNVTNVWDGKDNGGNELAFGTYFCIIEIDGKVEEKHWVELTR